MVIAILVAVAVVAGAVVAVFGLEGAGCVVVVKGLLVVIRGGVVVTD
jgi:hypothetical protein